MLLQEKNSGGLWCLAAMISHPASSTVYNRLQGILQSDAIILAAITALALWYTNTCYREWAKNFKHRPTREDSSAPSHKERPRVNPMSPDNMFGPMQVDSDLPKTTTMNKEDTPRASKGQKQQSAEEGSTTSGQKRAKQLDMDHLRIPFHMYLWCMIFVGPSAVLLWAKGLFVLKCRECLYRWGRLRPTPHDPSETVARLLLNSYQTIYYVGQKDRVAVFRFDNFPMLDEDGLFTTAQLLTVEVDLDRRAMSAAFLDGRSLSPIDTLVLIWCHTISASHVKIHSLANWAMPREGGNKKSNAFHLRMSQISLIYNYFGFSVFPSLCQLWHSWGLSRTSFPGIQALFQSGLDAGIPNHAFTLHELAHDSEVVSFTIQLRRKFHRVYRKHRDELHGVDPESFFVSTVVHSLDHTLMEWNLKDELWLMDERISPQFRTMAELGRIVRAGFVDDLPFLLFTKRYKHAKGPFYQSVYRHAANINKKLADHMDTCIIK